MSRTNLKKEAYRENFQKIGKAISSMLTPTEIAWRERNQDFEYQPTPVAVQDPALSSRMCGPQFKTLQYLRTVRLKRNSGE